MPEVARREPAEIVAGDTLSWVRELVEFPTPGWVLHYRLGPHEGGQGVSFVAAAEGAKHRVLVPATETAAWPVGQALLRAWVVSADGSQRYSVGVASPLVQVLEDPSAALAADGRSRARRVVDALEEAYEQLASKSVASSTVGGHTFTLRNLDELTRALQSWRARLELEEHSANPNRGKVYVRF